MAFQLRKTCCWKPPLRGTVVFAVILLPARVLGAESVIGIEDAHYRVEASASSGVILRIRDKLSGMELLQETRLADNFRFTLPIRGDAAWQATEANYILGKDQRLSSHRATPDSLVLRWDGPLTSAAGTPYEVSATMTIRLAGGEILFLFRIENRTRLEIGEVYCPVLGGSLGLGDRPEDRKDTQLAVPSSPEVHVERIFHTFRNDSWLGVIGPEQFYSYPDRLSMPWIDLYQPRLGRGVYFGAHDPAARYKVIHLEMLPGISGARPEGNWPGPEERQGLPAGVKLSLVHMPYQPPGQPFEASPVVLRFHEGDWHAGAKLYGQWFFNYFHPEGSRKDWLRRAQAIQECAAAPFRDLPAWARRGAEHGVRGLLVRAWAVDRDDGAPRFEPDPRLGSREDLAAAIRECQKLGVKVALAVDLRRVRQDGDWYRQELHGYACRDRWGIVDSQLGWGGGSTLTATFSSGQRRTWLNPGAPGLRAILVRQLRELAAMGVDGACLSGFFARPLDFNPATGKTPDRASWEGGLECIAEILQGCRAVQPDFCLSVDSAFDRLLTLAQPYALDAPERSPLRVALPAWRPTVVIAESDDFGAINDAVRCGARLRIAPSLAIGDPSSGELSDYLRTVLAAREALSETLLDGDYLGAQGLRVEGPATFGMFRSRAGGLRTVVFVNPRAKPVRVKFVGFSDGDVKDLILWQPAAGPRKTALPAEIILGGDEVAIVTEEPVTERLAKIAPRQLPSGAAERRPLFDFRSAADLEGWTLQGEAFSVSSLAGVFRTPTLNSIGKAGEPATGTALSPPFVVETGFDRLEVLFHGGTSHKVGGEEDLALRLLDAKTGAVLREIVPPSTHLLTKASLSLDGLDGKSLRILLVDRNTGSSFAWIGIRRVTLVRRGR